MTNRVYKQGEGAAVTETIRHGHPQTLNIGTEFQYTTDWDMHEWRLGLNDDILAGPARPVHYLSMSLWYYGPNGATFDGSMGLTLFEYNVADGPGNGTVVDFLTLPPGTTYMTEYIEAPRLLDPSNGKSYFWSLASSNGQTPLGNTVINTDFGFRPAA